MKKDTLRPLRHWALTGSRPSPDVTLIILRVADLAAALPDSLFEHPEVIRGVNTARKSPALVLASTEFFRSLLIHLEATG